MSSAIESGVEAAGSYGIGGMTVRRLGFGAAHVTGPGCWGPPEDRDAALRVLRRAVELGVNFIDTAASYGPYVSEEMIHEALSPYSEGLIIATKAGNARTGPDVYVAIGRPEFIRQDCEMSLRRLNVESLHLLQLHQIDPKVPVEEQFGVLRELQDEGKVRALGLSNVSVKELDCASRIFDVATVQNEYNLVNRRSEDVLVACESRGIGFIPWFPVANGDLARPGGPVREVCSQTGASPAKVALAWLLARSPAMLPIPGTASVAHLEENCAAGLLHLDESQIASLSSAG
ncbi:MAG: aldo/keto reductase [Acidimicrobiales bacterium]